MWAKFDRNKTQNHLPVMVSEQSLKINDMFILAHGIFIAYQQSCSNYQYQLIFNLTMCKVTVTFEVMFFICKGRELLIHTICTHLKMAWMTINLKWNCQMWVYSKQVVWTTMAVGLPAWIMPWLFSLYVAPNVNHRACFVVDDDFNTLSPPSCGI